MGLLCFSAFQLGVEFNLIGRKMDRNNQTETTGPIEYRDLVKQTAFHEAGHAAAMYLNNKSNCLPSVFFQITTKELCNNKIFAENTTLSDTRQLIAKIEGGQLIQNHQAFIIENETDSTETERQTYQAAYQTDIVNLLVGPLAEAKYVALRDNEPFNPMLVNANALKFYGGTSDLDIVYEYLDYFLNNKNEREHKLKILFNKAFVFINDRVTWKAITSLASYILNNENKTISCEDAFTVLDNSVNLPAVAKTLNWVT